MGTVDGPMGTAAVARGFGRQRRWRDVEPRALRANVARGFLAVGLGLVGQLSTLGLLATSAWLITTSSLRPPLLTLTVAIAAVRLFALLRGIGRYGERLASHDLALRVLARLRVWAYRRLEALVPGGLGRVSTGDVLSRVVTDVDATQDLLVRLALPLATGLATASVAVALAAVLLPTAGIALASGLALGALVIPALAHHFGRHGSRSVAAERARLTASIVETIEGAPDLIAFGAARTAVANVDRTEAELSRALRTRAAAAGIAHGLGTLVVGATTLTVTVLGVDALGSNPVGDGHLSAVAVAVLGFVTLASFEAISTLPEAFARLDTMLGSARRVRQLEDHVPPVSEPQVPQALPIGPPALVLDGVAASYSPKARAAIDGIDLALLPGKRVAVVGPSGAGKSTLALVALRFVDFSAGRVTLNGIDVRHLPSDHVRACIAWAPQDPHIFTTTLSANLRLARPDATDGDLVALLDALGLGRWLDGLPRGIHTELGERGVTVSGGERQRIGLARALLARRPILLLDEPTAHLDEPTETLVRRAVLARSAGRALLWITHRLAGLEDFDDVVVLRDGRVVERGHASVLAGRGGPYTDLFNEAVAAEMEPAS